MSKNINARIALKRDTSANWTNYNPVLLNGELILVDTAEGQLRAKVGDGTKTYTQLPFTDEALRALITDVDNNNSAVVVTKDGESRLLDTFNIIKLTQEEYDELQASNLLDPDALYLTEGEENAEGLDLSSITGSIVTGEKIVTLNDTIDSTVLTQLKLFGKSEQEAIPSPDVSIPTGKNLLNVSNGVKANSLNSFEVSDDGYTITATGSAAYSCVSFEAPILVGKNIVVKYETVSTVQNNVVRVVYEINAEMNSVVINSSTTISSPISIPNSATNIRVNVYANGGSTALDAPATTTITGLMVCLADETDLTWEPYQGGPVEIESVVADGVSVRGGNLLNYNAWKGTSVISGTAVYENNGITLTSTGNDCHTKFDGAGFPYAARIPVKAGETYTLAWDIDQSSTQGLAYIFVNGVANAHVYGRYSNGFVSITIPSNGSFITFRVGVTGTGNIAKWHNLRIVRGLSPAEYTPYVPTNRYPITPEITLRGIPVDSGGNYTDENGKQWICDTYDVATGEYVQRIGEYICTGNEAFASVKPATGTVVDGYSWFISSLSGLYGSIIGLFETDAKRPPLLCTHLKVEPITKCVFGNAVNCVAASKTSGNFYFRVPNTIASTAPEFAIYLAELRAAGNPLTIQYPLAEPIVTKRNPVYIPAYAPMTNVAADGDILVEYNHIPKSAQQVYTVLNEQIDSKLVVDSSLNSTSTNPVQNKVVNAALSGKFNNPVAIPANADLNDYKTSGVYAAVYHAEASTLLNLPNGFPTNTGVMLQVYEYNGVSFQVLYSTVSGSMYKRRYGNGAWNGWIKLVITTDMATTSANGLMSSTDKSKLDGIATGANKTTIDSALSSTSTNPVQNKVINDALAGKMPIRPVAIEMRGDSTNGGYIDFHYGRSTNDYTSRIIESESGTVAIETNLIVPGVITGTLNGNAKSATKLQTARTINGTSFNGTANINTAYAYNFSMGSTFDTANYTMFARTAASNSVGNVGATMLVSALGNFGGALTGQWLVQVSNRGSKPTMSVTTLLSPTSGTVTFGYYTTTDYFYFGVYTASYRAAGTVTVLSNVDCTIKNFGDVTTAPTGWTAVTPRVFSVDGHTHSNASLGSGYGTCATAEATTAKVVTLSNYALVTGGIVSVKFTYAVPASATMNINSKGAKAIYHRGAAIAAGVIKAGDVATFVYNGSQYHLISIDRQDMPKLTTARTIDGVSFNGTANIIHYGTCSTAAATAAKTVSCTGFTLATGARIVVKFTVTNTAASPTLNVNSTGAKAIMYRGSAVSAGHLAANRVHEFVYDGTNYLVVGDLDTNSTSYLSLSGGTVTGVTTFSNTTASTSTTTGAVKISGGLGVAGNVYANKVYGAVWNDYAEYREGPDFILPGEVVCEKGDDTLTLCDEDCEAGCYIVSDTFGFAIGQTKKANLPVAVSGRVLTYTTEDRMIYKNAIGRPVCGTKGGRIRLMTDEEAVQFPWKILGIVSSVPEYKTWGEKEVEVNERVWIKVR